jgi:hypothetical protein
MITKSDARWRQNLSPVTSQANRGASAFRPRAGLRSRFGGERADRGFRSFGDVASVRPLEPLRRKVTPRSACSRGRSEQRAPGDEAIGRTRCIADIFPRCRFRNRRGPDARLRACRKPGRCRVPAALALLGPCFFQTTSGPHRAAGIGHRFSALAAHRSDPNDRLVGERLMGVSQHFFPAACPARGAVSIKPSGCGRTACWSTRWGTAFTSTASQYSGHETTLVSFHFNMLHHGVIVVGAPYTEPRLMNMVRNHRRHSLRRHDSGGDRRFPPAKRRRTRHRPLSRRACGADHQRAGRRPQSNPLKSARAAREPHCRNQPFISLAVLKTAYFFGTQTNVTRAGSSSGQFCIYQSVLE